MSERLFGARTGFFMENDGDGGGGDGEKKDDFWQTVMKKAKEKKELLLKAGRLNKAHGRRTPKSKIKEATGITVIDRKIAAQQVARYRGSSEE